MVPPERHMLLLTVTIHTVIEVSLWGKNYGYPYSCPLLPLALALGGSLLGRD